MQFKFQFWLKAWIYHFEAFFVRSLLIGLFLRHIMYYHFPHSIQHYNYNYSHIHLIFGVFKLYTQFQGLFMIFFYGFSNDFYFLLFLIVHFLIDLAFFSVTAFNSQMNDPTIITIKLLIKCRRNTK